MTEQEILDALAAIDNLNITPADEINIISLKQQLTDIRYPTPVPTPPTQEELDAQAAITALKLKLSTQDLTLSELNELVSGSAI